MAVKVGACLKWVLVRWDGLEGKVASCLRRPETFRDKTTNSFETKIA